MKLKLFPILIVALFFISCNDNEHLLSKFGEIKTQIESNDWEGLVKNLDKKSIAYLEMITDTSNLKYEVLKEKAKKFDLQHYSIQYLFDFGGFADSMDNKYDALFLYYKVSGVPIFDIISEQLLLEDETKTGGENYVTLARKVADQKYITKKILFVKEGDEYKLNFLSIFSRHEKDLASAVRRYKKRYLHKPPAELLENPIVDLTKKYDPLYMYMHYSQKSDLQPKEYYYKRNLAKRKRIQ